MLAVIYCWSPGSTAPLPFDEFQRHEILLTILQAFLGWIFLASMSLAAYEAAGLFLLWLAQFVFPSLRHEMLYVYGGLDRRRAACSSRSDARRSPPSPPSEGLEEHRR